MDSRIDLTENRDFRKNSSTQIFINGMSIDNQHSFFINTKLYNFPWQKILSEWKDSTNGIHELFFTGSKKQILKKKLNKEKDKKFESEYARRCERCGKSMSVPWLKHYSLCLKCSDSLENEIIEINKDLPLTQRFKTLAIRKSKLSKRVKFRVNNLNVESQWVSRETLVDDKWSFDFQSNMKTTSRSIFIDI